MDNNFLKGIKFSLGVLLVLGIVSLVYAVGFHTPDEILSGTFTGDYEFTGIVNFTSAHIGGLAKSNITAISTDTDTCTEGDCDLTDLDGPGSGLDADTLDGYNSNEFIRTEVGDISGLTAGTGLTGGGTAGAVTLNVGAGAGINVAANSVAIDSSYTQRRVSGTCSAGSSIRAISATGAVTCETDDSGGSPGCTYYSQWFPSPPGPICSGATPVCPDGKSATMTQLYCNAAGSITSTRYQTYCTEACVAISCPFVYSYDGEEYVFEDEGITSFGLIPENEGKQPIRLPSLQSEDGIFKVKVTEELNEITYLDSVELLKVKHKSNANVYPGFKDSSLHGYPTLLGMNIPFSVFQHFKESGDSITKQFFTPEDVSTVFTLYTLENQIKPTSVTENGEEIKELLEIDKEFWNTNLEGFEYNELDEEGLIALDNNDDLFRSAIFTYPKENTNKAKLRLNVKETDYMAYSASRTVESARYHNIYDPKTFLVNVPSDSSYKISIWDGKEWTNEISFNIYPREAGTDIVVPLNLENINTEDLQIKITVSYGLLSLDGAYIDYSDDELMTIERVPLQKAIMQNNNTDVTTELLSSNNQRLTIQQYDGVELEFIGENEEDTTYFLNMEGHYMPANVDEDSLIKNKELLKRMFKEPGLIQRYWKTQFLTPKTPLTEEYLALFCH